MPEVITDNLDLWTSALLTKSTAGRGSGGKLEAYGIKKLRELILELAVRGKLVPQDANDEHTSVLLEKIAKEKTRLIKDGQLKKERLLPEIGDDEKSFELPQGWEWVRFGTITQHNSGKTLDSGRNTGQLRDYITTSNLYWGRFDLVNVRQMPITDDELGKCTARKGDLLICEGGESGRAAVWPYDHEVCFQNHVHRARFYGEEIDPYFVYRFFEKLNATGEIDQHRKGVGISNMSSKALALIALPLPPFAEQHRIVAKVDELMALCDQLEKQQTHSIEAHQTLVEALLATLTRVESHQEFSAAWARIASHFDTLFTTEASIDQLKQTILQLAVMGKLVPQDPNDEPASVLLQNIASEKERLIKEGQLKKEKPLPQLTDEEKEFPLPHGWVWTKFGVIAEFINGDRSKNYPNRSEYVDEGVAWINTGHIEPNGRLTTHDMNFISREKFDSLNSGKIRTGDLVYCLRGATFGKTAFVDPYEEGAIASSLMIIRPFITELNKYIFQYLVSPFGKQQLFRFDNGSAQPNLSAGNVTLYVFPLPPLAEQHRIVAKVDELIALCDILKAHLADAQTTQLHLADAVVEQAVA